MRAYIAFFVAVDVVLPAFRKLQVVIVWCFSLHRIVELFLGNVSMSREGGECLWTRIRDHSEEWKSGGLKDRFEGRGCCVARLGSVAAEW